MPVSYAAPVTYNSLPADIKLLYNYESSFLETPKGSFYIA